MRKLNELKEKLLNELGDYSDRDAFSRDDVESIKYMASAVDHLCHIIDEYDNYSEYYPMDNYSRRRDARGRYSMAMDDMTSEVKRLMKEAPNDQVKQEFNRLLTKLERM